MPENRDFAKALRRSMTDAEHRLWRYLRAGRMRERKFRRQVPIGPYVVDFVGFEARLVIEVDGGQHADDAVRDERRTAWLAGEGYRVIRFWNHDVLQRTDEVLAEIWNALAPSPQPLPHEGGGA